MAETFHNSSLHFQLCNIDSNMLVVAGVLGPPLN